VFTRLELLASGEREADEICSDYIGAFAERGRERELAEALAEALSSGLVGEWDELCMPSMNGESLLPWSIADALRRRDVPATVEVAELSPYVPLPHSFDAYLASLSSSRRYHLRRSIRDFERWAGGSVRIEVAESERDLARGFEVLVDLHRQRWHADGEGGVFESSKFRAFHELVMPRLLAKDRLDLSWLLVGDAPVAAAYGLVHAGRVQFYQSGRRADLPPKVRPGLVLHARAIERAIASGHREYDFLPGASDYKLGLALATRPVVTLRAAPPTLREAARALGQQLRAGARRIRAALAPKSQALQLAASELPETTSDARWPRILQSLRPTAHSADSMETCP
jgi:CelD/BcsL family acetyltransferase involved in cellulose biosynthesis